MYSCYIHTAIKERALAKHKSSETHVPPAVGSHSQLQGSSISTQNSGTDTNGKKWKAVYSDYKVSEQSPEGKGPPISATTISSPHSTSTTLVTFPGFANLGATKDQASAKDKPGDTQHIQERSRVMPTHVNSGKEQNNRIGYLMPDEDLLQEWTNSQS